MDENRAMIVEISEVPEIQVPNYEDLLSRLTEEMEAYRNYQVTEDNIPEAKKVKANLNNLTKQIEDERKRVKKIYETPLKEFEAKAKTLSGMVKEVSDEIKVQLDKYENDRQVRKYAWCVDKWFQLGGETAKLIDYTKIHKPSWVNASTPTAKIEEEMQSALRQITANIDMIRAMNLPEGDGILGKYLTTLDINAALAERQRIAEEKEKVEAVKKTEPKVTFIPMGEPEPKEEIPAEYKVKRDITFTVYNVDKIQIDIISKFFEDLGVDVRVL